MIGEYQAQNLNFNFGNGRQPYSSWGTWISGINLSSVPEPFNWAFMLVGVGLIGASLRSRSSPRTT